MTTQKSDPVLHRTRLRRNGELIVGRLTTHANAFCLRTKKEDAERDDAS